MASFTFAAGNTRALLRIPLYALGFLASLVVPRTGALWVVGCGVGLGEGAVPLYLQAREQAGVRVVWLATTDAELDAAKRRGFDAVLKSSARGLWFSLRAQVLVVTHGAGDLNRYGTRGGFLVQLWHGIPLKRLHLDSPVARSSRFGGALIGRVLTRGYRVAGARINLFPVASARVVGRIGSAFGIPRERIAVTGDPRDDVLLDGSPDERRAAARALLEASLGPLPAHVVMYAPTWRDGAPDPAVPDDATWQAIAAWLEGHDAALIVRNHPLGKGDYAEGVRISDRVQLLDQSKQLDVNPVLNGIDAMVTDYSSIAYDFALVDGPTVYLAADVADYVRARGLYEPYAEFSGGQHVTTWADALEQLDRVLAGDPTAAAHTRWLREEYFDHRDSGAAARVLAEIRRRLAGGSTAPATVDRVRVTDAVMTHDELVLGFAAGPTGVRLVGPRATVDATITRNEARFLLVGPRWGTPRLALPAGDYRVVLADGTSRLEVPEELPEAVGSTYRATVRADDGGLVVRVQPPFSPVGPAAYRHARPEPENAVWFESFYGRTVGDNPLGIDRALAASHPEVTRYWSVTDGSLPVPDGAIPVYERSEEWWRARASVRVLVVNDWLRWDYRRRPHQHVLQTWHGTMLKRLANDRPDTTPRRRLAVIREQRRWDALLAQNPYSADIFRSAYAVAGPIWQTGYPRNDVLADASRATWVRAAIGLAAGTRAVLYAPTWRDDRDELVADLDLPAFAASLPDDHVLLVRGHSRTLAHGGDVRGARIIDVTSYPDVADLMLVADVLVTDYSSVMFDFAATGKPMVFFVPDLADYGDRLRGFYFDLVADAPGPVVTTADELRAAIADPGDHAEKYASWRQRFVPSDDGAAGERVVARLYAEGWLG